VSGAFFDLVGAVFRRGVRLRAVARAFDLTALREAPLRADRLGTRRVAVFFLLRAAFRAAAFALRFAITDVLSASQRPEASLTVYP